MTSIVQVLYVHRADDVCVCVCVRAGRVTGGSLKTTEQADRESLQAGWFNKQELTSLQLRARDILPLIETGREWVRRGRKYGGLPVQLGHVCSSLRLILVVRDSAQLLMLVRSDQRSTTNFPVVDLNHILDKELKVLGLELEFSFPRHCLAGTHLSNLHAMEPESNHLCFYDLAVWVQRWL